MEHIRVNGRAQRWATYADGASCSPFPAGGDADVSGPAAPAGAASTCVSRVGNPLGWQGARLSAVTGAYDMRARHDDPRLRVFLSRDPLGYVHEIGHIYLQQEGLSPDSSHVHAVTSLAEAYIQMRLRGETITERRSLPERAASIAAGQDQPGDVAMIRDLSEPFLRAVIPVDGIPSGVATFGEVANTRFFEGYFDTLRNLPTSP